MSDDRTGLWDASPWTNWTGDLSIVPQRHYHPSSLEELIAIVRTAEVEDPPCEVHAAGSRWAFSGPSATTGFVVETLGLGRTLDTPITANLRTANRRDAHRWHSSQLGVSHVEAGVILHELCLRLDGRRSGTPRPTLIGPEYAPNPSGWALPTMGGSSGQTLAGAISTSTHGMDVELPPLADAVRALHLVGPGGRQHWIEREGDLTYDEAIHEVYPDIEIHRDDDLLAAATVSLGRFGIVYAVLLEVVPQFSLRTVTRRCQWEDASRALAAGKLLESHRAVQVVVSPYPSRRGRACYVTTRDRVDAAHRTRSQWLSRAISRALNWGGSMLAVTRVSLLAIFALTILLSVTRPSSEISLAAVMIPELILLLALPLATGRPGDAVARLCAWANRRGDWRMTSSLVRAILGLAQRSGSSSGVSFQVMAGPPWADEYYRGHSIEVFFDATKTEYLQVISRDLLPIIEENARGGRAVAGWVSLRFSGRSAAPLAMQRWDRTVSVEIAVLRGIPGSVEVLREIEKTAVRNGGTIHWGQQNDLSSSTVSELFDNLPEWRKQMGTILGSAGIDTFNNEFCRRRGLTP